MIRIFRANHSPYQSPNFIDMERAQLQTIDSIEYIDNPNDCDILLSNTHTDFGQYAKKKLQLVVHTNSGYDNIPIELVQANPYPIIVGNSIRAQAVTQYIISAFCQHFCTPTHQAAWEPRRKWNRKLASATNVLLVGLGHIGTHTKNTLSALACSITCYDPYREEDTPLIQLPLEEFDALILCASLNPSSHHLLNQDIFKRLKPSCAIINAARGALINQDALLEFLGHNPQAFAYLDVFEKEPYTPQSFDKLSNIKTTSHIAGVFTGIDETIIAFEKEVIKDFLTSQNFKQKYSNQLLQNRIRGNILI